MQNNLNVKLSDLISQLYFGSDEKKTKGDIVVSDERYYFKIQNLEFCEKEMSGYDFVKKYYPVPQFLVIISIGDGKGAVVSSYENSISKNEGLLVDIFSRGVFSDDEKKELSMIIELYNNAFEKTLVKSMHSASDIFFRDRIATRIEKFYNEVFLEKAESISSFSLNNFEIKLEIRKIMSDLEDFFKNKKETWCIVSQCDPNDLNIGTKPVIFDYLAGGLNPLMAEFATLFWYNLAQGGYLSLKYNKESFHGHERMFLFQSKLERDDDKLTLDIAESRKYFLISYIEKIIQPLYERVQKDDTWDEWYDEFKNYLAMKILGVFDISKMEQSDMLLSLGYLQFFYDMKLNKPSDLIKIVEKL